MPRWPCCRGWPDARRSRRGSSSPRQLAEVPKKRGAGTDREVLARRLEALSLLVRDLGVVTAPAAGAALGRRVARQPGPRARPHRSRPALRHRARARGVLGRRAGPPVTRPLPVGQGRRRLARLRDVSHERRHDPARAAHRKRPLRPGRTPSLVPAARPRARRPARAGRHRGRLRWRAGRRGRGRGRVVRGRRRVAPPACRPTAARASSAARRPTTRRGACEQQYKEHEAFTFCQLRIRERALDMKLTRVEHAFDGSKLLFYYTAEHRVDFRELVRDLAAAFHMRIEMRQIGVRDEARLLGGYGPCGRPLCCTTWLHVVRAGVDQDGQAAGPEPESVQAGRRVRAAEVLPALRAAQWPRRTSRRVRAGRPLRQRVRRGRRLRHGRLLAAEVTTPRTPSDPAAAHRHHRRRSGGHRAGDREAAAASREVRAVCEPVLYGPHTLRGARGVPGRAGECGGRPGRLRRHRRGGGRRAGRRGAGHRDRPRQQGGVRAGRPAVEGPHRSAGASHRQRDRSR